MRLKRKYLNWIFIYFLLFILTIEVIAFLSLLNNTVTQSPDFFEYKDGMVYKGGTDIPFTGVLIDTVENRIIEYNLINGLKNGDFVIYLPSGQIGVYGQMINNKNNGKWSYFYPDGKIESEGMFKEDLAEGLWTWYYPTGRIREQGYFWHGNREGKWSFYDQTGQLEINIIFNNDEVVDFRSHKKLLSS